LIKNVFKRISANSNPTSDVVLKTGLGLKTGLRPFSEVLVLTKAV